MKNKSQLPFLIRLMDDKSERVREKVANELRSFGTSLEDELRQQGIDLTASQRRLIGEILQLDNDDLLRREWLSWLDSDHENVRLEGALEMLARWQSGADYAMPLGVLLDDMAEEYRHGGWPLAPKELSQWLFTEQGKNLQGVATENLYNPRYSNLIEVVESGRGIPISLATVFILVGHRLGLEISGCNFPGHFLARALVVSGDGTERELVFDCYSAGRMLAEHEVSALYKAAPQAMHEPAAAVVIVARVLRNLVVAFEQVGSVDKARLMLELLGELEQSAGV